MTEVEVTILNWEKYHPRKDVSNPSWLRLQNRMWNDSQFFSFAAEELWVWICLLSIASQKQSPVISFSLEWLSQESKAKLKVVEITLEKLTRNGCVTWTLRGRNVHGRNVTDVTDVTNVTDITEQYITNCTVAPESGTPVLISKKTLLDKTSELVRKKILETYPDPEFISQELKQMEIWVATNPEKSRRTQKGWGQFLNNWFKKSWDKYQKSLISHPVSKWPKVYHEELWKPVEKLDDR